MGSEMCIRDSPSSTAIARNDFVVCMHVAYFHGIEECGRGGRVTPHNLHPHTQNPYTYREPLERSRFPARRYGTLPWLVSASNACKS